MGKAPTIFGEIPESIDETWTHGAALGGAFSEDDAMLARSYFAAGAVLINHVLSDHLERGQDWLGPVLFSYRHGIELYLKAIVKPPQRNHSLGSLLEGFCRLARSRYQQELPRWVTKPIAEFIEIDRKSDFFRFGDPNAAPMDHTHWIDFRVLRRAMAHLEWAFERTLWAEEYGLRDIDARFPAPRLPDNGDDD